MMVSRREIGGGEHQHSKAWFYGEVWLETELGFGIELEMGS